jgi:hypothetical protein
LRPRSRRPDESAGMPESKLLLRAIFVIHRIHSCLVLLNT